MEIINHQIICAFGGRYISYRRGRLYISDDLKRFSFLCRIPMSNIQHLFACFRITSRFFRLYPRAVETINEHCFIFGFQGKIYNVDIDRGSIVCEHEFPFPMKTPLSFTKIDGLSGFDNCIIYGEYHANLQKREMSVYARRNGIWSVVYSFSPYDILHIHGFCVDRHNNRVLMLTGDKDHESGIYEIKDNFKHVKPVVIGSQKYRSCVAFVDGDSVVYATDTPLEQNAIYRLDNSGLVEKLFDMPGPTIYGTMVERNDERIFVFATSVEPDSRITGKRYLVTNKLGPGVKERYCHIIAGNTSSGFKTLIRLKKDWLPMTAFQFGNASFCQNNCSLFITPQSIKKLNEKTIVVPFKSINS